MCLGLEVKKKKNTPNKYRFRFLLLRYTFSAVAVQSVYDIILVTHFHRRYAEKKSTVQIIPYCDLTLSVCFTLLCSPLILSIRNIQELELEFEFRLPFFLSGSLQYTLNILSLLYFFYLVELFIILMNSHVYVYIPQQFSRKYKNI